MTLRVLSLFSGAGGSDLALEAAGMSIAALCEIEPHARAVLREHWPDAELHGDVSELDGTQYRGKVDIVVGGSPCQDLSVAGKRAGLTEGSGTRSSLFYEQVRIWNESDAPYLIWENVKGAFSSSQGADFAAVLSAIVGRPVPVRRDGWSNAGVVCGPAAVAAWRLLDLQHFGVPQRRERIVVLAARAGGVDPAEVLAVSQSLRWDSAPRFQAREGVARDAGAGAGGAGGVIPILEATSRQGKSAEGSVGIGKDGDPMFTLSTKQHGVFDVKAVNISNAVATLDDVMGTLDADGASTTSARADGSPCADRGTNMVVQAFGISSHAKYVEASVASSLRAEGGDLGGGSENLALGNQMNAVLTYDARGNGNGVVANTLAGDHQNRVTDYTALVVGEQARTLAFKVRGGVEVDSAGKTAGKGYLGSDEVAFTLSGTQDQQIHQPAFRMVAFGEYAEDGTASAIKARDFKDATDLAMVAPGIPRRLTPKECERLMGWGDDWTRWGVNEKGKRYELADTPRYKLCGNGIGKEWMEWVGLRLMEAEGLTDTDVPITLPSTPLTGV